MTSSQPSRRRVLTSRDAEVDGPAVLSMSDLRLAQCYQFVEETGVGNWGSVWLGRDKTSPDSHRVALKVVHRSTRSKTSGVRVRSLWNEMKIIRPLNSEQHPSIVSFNCFIITPSYAIIAMEYLPTLMQVEIDERKAKPWFASLASAIEWLHAHGVVHNDIKPANILLSDEGIPKLVDFGFAERYELKGPRAFESQLAYGTPEYLCPERAKGNVHDTRKSDVWSLAITFFEILTGRTPFEREGESFSTKEELETYWKRTVSGRWLDMKRERSNSRISPALEALLKRMLAPNARVRLTAAELCKDSYWIIPPPDRSSQEEAPFKRRFSIFSELSSKSGTTGKSKMPSRVPLRGDKGPTPATTLTKATKAVNVSMASGLSSAVPRNVGSPEPRAATENAPPSAFRQPNRGKNSRKTLSGVFDTQVQTAAVNFGDDESSPSLLCQSQSSIFSLQQAVRDDRAETDTDHSRMSAWIESLEKTVEDTKNSFLKRDPNALPPAPRDLGSNHSRQSSINIFAPLLGPDPALSSAMETGEGQDGSSTETQKGKLGVYRPPKSVSQDHDAFLTPKKRRATVTNIFSQEAVDAVAQTGETRRIKSSVQLIGTITPKERATPPPTRRASKRLSQIINEEERDMFFSASRGGSPSPALLTPEPSLSTPVDADIVDSPLQGSNMNTVSSNGTGMSNFYDRFLVSMSDIQRHTEGLYNFESEPRSDASIQNKSEAETRKKRGSKFWVASLGRTHTGKGKSPAHQDDAVDDFGSGYLHPTAASRVSGFGSPGTPTSERSSFSKSKMGGKRVKSSVRKAFNIFKNGGASPATPTRRPIF